ncbi:unnamed protein product [Pylaiella littoralis]
MRMTGGSPHGISTNGMKRATAAAGAAGAAGSSRGGGDTTSLERALALETKDEVDEEVGAYIEPTFDEETGGGKREEMKQKEEQHREVWETFISPRDHGDASSGEGSSGTRQQQQQQQQKQQQQQQQDGSPISRGKQSYNRLFSGSSATSGGRPSGEPFGEEGEEHAWRVEDLEADSLGSSRSSSRSSRGHDGSSRDGGGRHASDGSSQSDYGSHTGAHKGGKQVEEEEEEEEVERGG